MAKQWWENDPVAPSQGAGDNWWENDPVADTEATPPAPTEGRTALDIARDVGVTAIKGAVGLPQAFAGLVDIPTLGHAGRALESVGYRPDDTQKMLDGMYSEQTQADKAYVGQADGFVDTLGRAIERPSTITTAIGESIPLMLGGAGVARGLLKVAPKVAPWLAGALGEGVMGAGSAASQIREQTTDGLLTPGQAAAAVGSGAGTAAFGAAGGKLANKLGLGDVDTMLAQGAGKLAQSPVGFVKQVIGSGISEGAFEELPQSIQEQMWQNYALGKPIDEGVGNAAAMGLLAGTAMGGAGGGYNAAMSSRVKPEAAQPEPPVTQPAQPGTPGQGAGVSQPTQAAPNEPTAAEQALRTPVALTSLDRVNEIDQNAGELQARLAELNDPASGYGPMFDQERLELTAKTEALTTEKQTLTKDWPVALDGKPASFTTEAGARVEAKYALMDAGDLVTSHDEALRQNPAYPQELQPRSRDRAASEMQVSGIVQKLDPARLGLSADAANGAPVVGADGLVESGNARTIALKRVYQANGQKAADYKQFLRDNADQFGLTPEAIDGMAKPVLVRVRTTPVNRAEFARQANASTVAMMSPSETAKSDANRIESMEDLMPDESGDFSNTASQPFIRRFMARLPQTEQSGMQDASGALSTAGYARVRNAVLAKAYGDSPVLARMTESMDDNLRNVSRAFLLAAPKVASMRAAVKDGTRFDADITPDLMAAAEELSKIKSEGGSVQDALAQIDMMGEQRTPEARQLLQFMSDNMRRPRRMADFISAYMDALDAAGDPNQGSLLGDVQAPAKQDLLKAAERTTQDATQDTQRGNPGESARSGAQAGGQPQDAPGGESRAQGDGVAGRDTRLSSQQDSTPVGERTQASQPISTDWVEFAPESGAMGIPRAKMPQVKADKRPALYDFLMTKGITHSRSFAKPGSLKPTQAEYSPSKAENAKALDGQKALVLASSDGYILDGHHRWVSRAALGEMVDVIKFSAPMGKLLEAVRQFPGATTSNESAPSAATNDLAAETSAPAKEDKAEPTKAEPTTADKPVDELADEAMLSRGASSPDQTTTEAFKAWFGDSKVVDKDGKPLVVYHGTSADEQGDAFTSFDTYASNYGLMGMGGYFTADPGVASSYTTNGRGSSPSVYPVFLSIKKPLDMDAMADAAAWTGQFDDIEAFHDGGTTNESWYRAAEDMLTDQEIPKYEGAEIMQDGLRAMGFDGITHVGGGRVKADGIRHRVFIAFDPEQIKSATGNNGDFDGTNPDIRMSRGAGGGMDLKALKSLAYRIRSNMPNMPDVHVYASPADLPERASGLRDYIVEQGAMQDVEGAMHKGELYLFASGLADALRAEHVLAEHEAAHVGLRAVLGGSLNTTMLMIYNNNTYIRQLATELQKRGKLSNAAATEEAIVDIPSARLVKLQGWRKLVVAARNWLESHGYEAMAKKISNWLDGTLNDQQRADLFVADLVRGAREYIAGKREGRTVTTGTMLASTLAEDIARQEKWLMAEAKARGYKDIDQLAEQNYPLFEKLATLWRKKNPAENGVLLSRGKNGAMTNNDVVGNQGGRSADDSIPGAAKRRVIDSGINFVSQVEALAEKHGRVFIRWSPSAKNDLIGNQSSRDFTSGATHSGLSAVEITGDMHPVDIASRLSEYGFLRLQDRRSTPHVFLADRVGTDSDGYASIKPKKLLLDSDSDVVKAIDFKLSEIMDPMDNIERESQKLESAPGHPAVSKRLADAKAKLNKLLPNESTAPDSGGAMLSRAPLQGTATERADKIIQTAAGTAQPIDAIARTLTRVTGIERMTGAIYNRAAYLLDRLTPETVKAGMVSDYGVPEAVIDQRAMMQGRQRVQLRQAGVLIDKLSTLTRAESRVAYEWMNEQDPHTIYTMMQSLPDESVKVLQDVQAMIDKLSRDAVRMGQLSPEAYEANKFAYLRRSYAKYTLDQTPGEKASRARAISVLGDQYKGRGLTEAAAMKQIQNDAPEWWQRKMVKGKADTSLKGEKLIRLERRATSGQKTGVLPGVDGNKAPGRILEVHFFPAGERLPAKYADWTQAATFEVRDVKGDKVVLWRDFTKDEREKMGEIDEARFAIAKTLQGMVHDVEVGRYLEWLAHNYAKKEGETIPGVVVEASERYRDTFKPGEWVRVPDSKLPGTNVLKYGKLAGRYLPGPVWNDLRQSVNGQFRPFGDTYAKILSAWKTAKTALSPAVHTNNIMSNFVMADWHDVTAGHTAKALRILMSAHAKDGKGLLGGAGNKLAGVIGAKDSEANREVLNRYLDSGGDIGSWATNEIGNKQIEPLLEALEKELEATGGQSAQAQVGIFHALQSAMQMKFPTAWEALKGSKPGKVVGTEASNLIDLYQSEDDVFRLAAWLKAKEEGKTDMEAGKIARRSFMDYSINAPWVQALRNSALPFISYTYRAVPMMLEIVGKKPHKLLKLMAFAGALNAFGVMLAGGGDDDDEKARKLLPEEKAGRVWGMVPKLIRMPWNDDNGSPVYLDIRRFIPVGDVFDVGAGHTSIPILPMMQIGGPLAIIGELYANKTNFTGKPITLETDTGMQKTAKVLDYLYKAFMPNIIGLPGTYATTGVVNAASGKTDAFGREQSVAQAMASSFGVKLGSYPADVMAKNLRGAAQAKIMEIDRNISSLKRQRMTNGIDAAEFESKVRTEQEKKVKVQRELMEKLN